MTKDPPAYTELSSLHWALLRMKKMWENQHFSGREPIHTYTHPHLGQSRGLNFPKTHLQKLPDDQLGPGEEKQK
jgi:hypothetical protein